MSQSIFPGPIAPQNNPAITPEWFQPSKFKISAISQGPTTTVTTLSAFGIDNNYVVGQLVRFVIPSFYGIPQLNEIQAYVIDIPATNQFVVNIDSSNFDAFVSSPSYSPTPAEVMAIGGINTGSTNLGRSNNATTIPGTFINISPAAGG